MDIVTNRTSNLEVVIIMAKTEKFPMKTPDVKEKKISEKERDEGGYGMANKDGVTYPPAKKEHKK
jgi:hypothetical protein